MPVRFPPEVITSILSCLPVKSILRFRCLSKPTCFLIDSLEFVKLHLDRSVSTDNNVCLVIDERPSGTIHFVDVDVEGSNPVEHDRTSLDSMDIDEEDDLDYDEDDEGLLDGNLLATCNGLVALYDGLQGMILWNPSTDRQQLVPNFWGQVRRGDTILDGFGYDAVNDDYKLVRIKQRRRDQTGKAMVYSSKSKTSRTVPSCPHVYSEIWAKRPGVYVAGSLNWVAFNGEEDEYEEDAIIGFDLATESFHALPQPEMDAIHSTTLGALGGCLALSCCFSMAFDLEIWVMKEYRVKESWTKLVTISNAEQAIFEYRGVCTRPLYLTSLGDRVLLEMQGHYLFWYSIRLKRIERFDGFANLPSKFYSEVMFRSLVPLNP